MLSPPLTPRSSSRPYPFAANHPSIYLSNTCNMHSRSQSSSHYLQANLPNQLHNSRFLAFPHHWPNSNAAPLSAPLTPPTSSTLSFRKPTLPSIQHIDKPFEDHHTHSSFREHPPSPPSALASPTPNYFSNISQHFLRQPLLPSGGTELVEWLDFTQHRSSEFIAEKTCEMICYFWFNPSPGSSFSSPHVRGSKKVTSALQFSVLRPFVLFVQKLLETTQVSQSVIVLSLQYIFRLRDRNHFTPAQPGSEFRIAVAGLMMANKFLDDNTYTNKTWSEVSGIDLNEINRMEREFLSGIDFGLYVDKPTYASWLNLLKGLVLAKEHDCRSWKSRRGPRQSGHSGLNSRHNPPNPSPRRSHRARSTSPDRSSRYQAPSTSPPIRSGDKRTADIAFSPTSAHLAAIPFKRPVRPTVQIPGLARLPILSHSPVEGLQSFSQMSLASPCRPPHGQGSTPPSTWQHSQPRAVSQTLTTAHFVGQQQVATPQNLYYYTLACSPDEQLDDGHWRKSRLRCHKPAPPPPVPRLQIPSYPMNIQSASTSPTHLRSVRPVLRLPSASDAVWYRPAVGGYQQSPADAMQGISEGSPASVKYAPFANAGPPGVQFYSTSQRTPPFNDLHWVRRNVS